MVSFVTYVLYKMHLRLTTSKTFYGTLIFVGTYFKSNINIILLCNTMFYSMFLIFYIKCGQTYFHI